MIPINRPSIDREEINAVTKVLKSGFLSEKCGSGPNVKKFEGAFAEFVGAKHAVAVSSGTAALHSALLAAGIRAGDEVIVPSFTFHATAGAVILAGARPVFADIDPETYCITAETIKQAMTSKTKAIIPVDMYGLCVDMKPVIEFARSRGLVIIEDAAQAHGAEYDGKRAGSMNPLTCFSFYAGKNMTTGEGGMVTTNSDSLAEQVRIIRTHGEKRPYWVIRQGTNYHMTELSAAIGLVQLKKLPRFLVKRRKNAEHITEALSGIDELVLPTEPSGRKHAWYLFTLRLRNAGAKSRDRFVEKLHAQGIGAAVYYAVPVHMLPLYHQLLPNYYNMQRAGRSLLPETVRACNQVFSLPVHPQVKPDDLILIVKSVKLSL